MHFRILGPLTVQDGQATLTVSGARQRTLLAGLLIHAGRIVPSDRLSEMLWDDVPSADARGTIRAYVMRLRRTLGPAAGGRIVTRYPGYLIDVREEEVDLLRFTALCRAGGAAVQACSWQDAADVLARALEMWRGPAFADIPSPVLHRDEAPQLEELRLQATEWRLDACLHLGVHSQLVPQLQHLAREHPLRERFHAQLMLALYRCGRQGEALQAYRRARGVLVGELGLEPGPQLRLLHQSILAADPDLLAPAPAEPAGPPSPGETPFAGESQQTVQAQDIPGPEAVRGRHVPASPALAVPRQLPGPVPRFVGRTKELATLDRLLDPAAAARRTVVISAIGGTAGVGKTALVLHWAHQATERFPDGQLYVNLHGYDPAEPLPTAEALGGFLRALGVAGERVPHNLEERAALYRSLLAGRQVLVVLDNAGSAEQARALLPGAASCMTVVTSRSSLAGLVARDGAVRLDLDLLPPDEAVALLRALIGERAVADPQATAALAGHCSRLPLALRLAAEFAVSHPNVPLADLAGELADRQRRLDLLDADADPRSAVRAVLSWSYQQLGTDAARLFRLLGLHPGPDVTVAAAASLLGADLAKTRCVLWELTRGYLLAELAPGRYGCHDLLRAYAAELARSTDAGTDLDAAIGRVLGHFLRTAHHAAALMLKTLREPITIAPSLPGVTPARLCDGREALAWFEAEYRTLTAAVALAAATGSDTCAWQLPWTMACFLDGRGHWQEQAVLQRIALAAATRLRDPTGQAVSGRLLASACTRLGDYDQACVHLTDCMVLYREIGDVSGEARIHESLCWVAEHQSRYADALRHAEQALCLFQAIGDKAGQASALNAIGWYHAMLADYQRACSLCRQALAVQREIGHRYGEAHTWDSLGYAEQQLGHLAEAANCYQLSLAAFRELGDQFYEATILVHIGDNDRIAGKAHEAEAAWRHALTILERLGHSDADQVRAKLQGAALLPGKAS
jgi:DNA-binding SARP family transcriptional activator